MTAVINPQKVKGRQNISADVLVAAKIKRTSLVLAEVVVFAGGLRSKDGPCLNMLE